MLLNVSPDAPLYEPLGSAPSQFVCGFFATISERGLAVFLQDGIVANRIGQCNKTTPVGLIQQSYNGSAGTPLPCEQDIDRPIVILINDLGGKLAVRCQS